MSRMFHAGNRCPGVWALALTIILLVAFQAAAAEDNKRMVTLSRLEGKAFAAHGKNGPWETLRLGDSVMQGRYVKTDDRSRAELRLPDGGVVRLAPATKLRLSHLYFPSRARTRQFEAKLFIGRIWAKVRRLAGADSYYSVGTPTAVAGVRGTAFQVNYAGPTYDSLFKVYEGRVAVQGAPQKGASQQRRQVGPPREVPGPRQVQGPQEVSKEEWERIVSSWQFIRVSPEGTASEPADLNPVQDSAEDEFTAWNLELDKIALPDRGAQKPEPDTPSTEPAEPAPSEPADSQSETESSDSQEFESVVPPIRAE